jgi:hypothetical protein
MGYPGSLIQQDHGEQLWDHGFLAWDLERKTVTPYHVPCPEGYLTIKGPMSTIIKDGRLSRST